MHEAIVMVSDIQISMAVYHRKDNRFMMLKSQPILDPEDFKSFVNYELNFPFKSVKVLICNQFNCLYPEPLFDRSKTKDLYTFNHTYNQIEEELVIDKITSLGSINIYKISILLRELLNAYFKNYQLIHYTTPALLGTFSEAVEQDALHIYLNQGFLHIIYKEGKSLKLINSYDYETHEDILYYILAVYEQLGLNLKNLKLKIHGDTIRFAELFSLLKKYIMEVSLGSRPSNMIYDVSLDPIPEHLFYQLFAAPLCE